VHRDYLFRGRNGYTSPPPRVRAPRHVVRLVTRLVALVVDYSASQARRRLLLLRRTSGCLGTSRGSSRSSSRRSSSTTPPRRLVVDYFSSAARPGASTHRAARYAARRAACRRLLRLAGSSSTTSPPPRVRFLRHVARHVARLVTPLVVGYFASRRLVVDYFAYASRPGASAHRAARRVARCAARRRLLHLRRASGCLGTSRGSSSTTPYATTSSCGHAGSTSATPCVVNTCLAATLALLRVRRAPPRRHLPRSHRVDHSSRLVFQTSRERQSRPQQLVGINSD
jgi:hypothetical protein